MAKVYVKEHELVCPECGADLTRQSSIRVQFSDGNSDANTCLSQVDADGKLADPTGQISIGMHAGSYCDACDELLDELE